MGDIPMNDEERQTLCAELRRIAKEEEWWSYVGDRCKEAADEIERLVKENARLVWENARLVWENWELKTELDDS